MRVNNITNINFRENTLSREMKSEDAILMLRDPKATVRFQQNQEFTRKADSVDTDPFTALGYKLYRTFNKLKGDNSNNQDKSQKLDTVA